MSSLALSFAAAPALIAMLPVAQAHMAFWAESMYGFSQPYEPVTPLAGKSLGEWWFHGNQADQPAGVTTLVPGSDLTVEIACRKEYTSFGGNPSSDACPGDSGAYHAGGTTNVQSGWSGNEESNLMGCALAIAFKPTALETNPEDFTVMSIQENCVRQRLTNFAIPNNLPACPQGGCTCAWFWQGKNSAEEMYMTGFRCNVQGGSASGYPTPVPPRKGAIPGPTQPMYWANTPTNLDYTPDWGTKPSYNSAWGWTNGAQTSAFGAASAVAPPATGAGTNTTAGTGAGPGYGVSTSAGAGYDVGTSAGAGPGYTSAHLTSAGAVGGDHHKPTSSANYAPSPAASTGYNGGGEYDAEPTSTRRGGPRPTKTHASWDDDDEEEEGEEEEVPPWKELAADPVESESEEGAGELALVQEPKKCNRHSKRRSRNRARKAHSS